MKKSLLLLTSLLATGTAIAPVLTHEVSNQENVCSLDVVDLTMTSPVTSAKVDTPKLTKLLNANLTPGQYPLNNSKLILTAPDGKAIEAISAFDNGALRSILGRATQFTNVTLEVSKQYPYANYIMAQYTYWESSENREKNDVKVINRFNWTGIDMTSFWTKDVKCEFELTF